MSKRDDTALHLATWLAAGDASYQRRLQLQRRTGLPMLFLCIHREYVECELRWLDWDVEAFKKNDPLFTRYLIDVREASSK